VSELIAFVFRDQYRAPEVLNELRRRDWPWVKDLDDAVVITLDQERRARVQLTIDPGRSEARGWARFWSSLLTRTLLFSLTEVMVGAAESLLSTNRLAPLSAEPIAETEEASWWRESLQHSENFPRDLGALMVPKGSALFILLRAETYPVVLKQLRNYGDTIIHTSVSSEQDDKLRAMFAIS